MYSKLTSLRSVLGLIFSIGMSKLTEVGIGNFVGEGNLEIGIPGEGIIETPLQEKWWLGKLISFNRAGGEHRYHLETIDLSNLK